MAVPLDISCVFPRLPCPLCLAVLYRLHLCGCGLPSLLFWLPAMLLLHIGPASTSLALLCSVVLPQAISFLLVLLVHHLIILSISLSFILAMSRVFVDLLLSLPVPVTEFVSFKFCYWSCLSSPPFGSTRISPHIFFLFCYTAVILKSTNNFIIRCNLLDWYKFTQIQEMAFFNSLLIVFVLVCHFTFCCHTYIIVFWTSLTLSRSWK